MTARRFGGLAIVVAAVIGCGAPAATTPVSSSPAAESSGPSLSPRPPSHVGRLLFARAGGPFADETVFISALDGADEQQLTVPGAACCPTLSPDGSLVLLMLNEQPEGGPITGGTLPLAQPMGSPMRLPTTDPTLNLVPQTWVDDPLRIVFEGWDGSDPGRTGVYVANADGSDLVRLTVTPGDVHDIPADVSPDGRTVVFYRTAPEPDWDQGGTLWLVGMDGAEARRIETPGVRPSWWARWSPDGSRVLFASGRLEEDGALWTVDADGSNMTRLFEDPQGRFPITPTWSPDGRQILLGLDPINDEFQHPANDVYVIDADGTNPVLAFRDGQFKRRFEWSR